MIRYIYTEIPNMVGLMVLIRHLLFMEIETRCGGEEMILSCS